MLICESGCIYELVALLTQVLAQVRARMPNAFISTEGSLLGLQSSIGLALTHSFDLHSKQEALVRACKFRFSMPTLYQDCVLQPCFICRLMTSPPSHLTAAHSYLPPQETGHSAVHSALCAVQELHRPDKQAYSSLLLETWLNEVLHTTNPATPRTTPKVFQAPALCGLCVHTLLLPDEVCCISIRLYVVARKRFVNMA